MMKIKLNETHRGDWRYVNCPKINLYYGKCITYRQSNKYGYRFNIIQYQDAFYITQALYSPIDDTEHVSVHRVHSVNDAKAVLEVMIQFIVGMRQPIDA